MQRICDFIAKYMGVMVLLVAAFARRLGKCSTYEQAVNGNLLLEACVSADKQFAALRLCQWSQIDYQPVSEVHLLQGDDAAQAAKVFSL